ncbi:hypothetical protein SGPA1_12422 [Streptomyces misionensis JCM 4497]
MPGGPARRCAQRGRAGRRPHLRSPDRAAPGLLRGRHDRRLVPAALRRPLPHLDPHHQRGPGRQPRRPRRHLQAAGHHRVGVIPGSSQDLSFGSGRISERGLVCADARWRREPMRSIGD